MKQKMSAEQIADLYHKYGLDQPIINRFFLYLKNMLHGDFGISYSLQVNMKISEMIGPKILVTIRLGLQAALVGTVIGALLGIIAALRQKYMGRYRYHYYFSSWCQPSIFCICAFTFLLLWI